MMTMLKTMTMIMIMMMMITDMTNKHESFVKTVFNFKAEYGK